LVDRFRLIYLKSTAAEKDSMTEDDRIQSPGSTKEPDPASSGEKTSYRAFFSKTLLNQAKTDLDHPDPKVRIMAIQFLEKSGPAFFSAFQEIMSDPDPDVRFEAIRFWAKSEQPLESPLLKRYLKDPDPRIRMVALRGLFRRPEKVDLNLLLQFLSDESSMVRRKLATLLGWVQMEGVFPVLVELSRDQNSGVRKAALMSLFSLYPEESEDRLIKALTDPDPDIRNWAKSSLVKELKEPRKGAVPPSGQDRR
jgi:HEAT repeat protein